MSGGTGLRWSGWRPRWWADTLGKRLFILLWVTLVLSHMLGFWLAHQQAGERRPGETGPGLHPGWFMPGLPPVMGLLRGEPPGEWPQGRPPQDAPSRERPDWPDMARPHGPQDEAEPGAWPGSPRQAMPHHPPPMIWLDYAVRVLVMGLAAWLGSRWLTAPMRRLTQASQDLEQAVSRGGALPVLDEQRGPQEVRQTAHVFNQMARGLHDQFEQRGLMMAAVSHDLRTPLTRLRMRLESLRPDAVVERCVGDVNDINAMIESVLDVMNEARRQEAPQNVDLLAMVQAMADDLQEAGQPVTASGDAVTTSVQAVALKRVLNNLIHNALRYGHAADIRISCSSRSPCSQPSEVTITVDDRGPGIAPDQLEAVFKPFVRLDSSRSRDTGGVGLGLYIARELVHRHGGRIRLLNRSEGGLCAEVTLPMR